MAHNQIYDVAEMGAIAGFLIGILSIPGFLYGGFDIAGYQLGLVSTVSPVGVEVMIATLIALISYLSAGFIHEAWGALTEGRVHDVERVIVAGETVILLAVPLIPAFGDFVVNSLLAGVVFVVVGIASIVIVVFRW